MAVAEYQIEQWVQFYTQHGWQSGKIIELRPAWCYVQHPTRGKVKVALEDLKPLGAE